MPLYEYQCESCAHRFEVIHKYSDAPVKGCPKCGGPVEKLVSSPAIQFKGSGFYLTDYGRGGKSDTAPGQGAQSESGSKSESGEKAEKADKGEKGTKSEKSDAAPSSGPSSDSGSAKGSEKSSQKTSDSKPSAPASPKSD
jgi:putative FmdB family regulatory protein